MELQKGIQEILTNSGVEQEKRDEICQQIVSCTQPILMREFKLSSVSRAELRHRIRTVLAAQHVLNASTITNQVLALF